MIEESPPRVKYTRPELTKHQELKQVTFSEQASTPPDDPRTTAVRESKRPYDDTHPDHMRTVSYLAKKARSGPDGFEEAKDTVAFQRKIAANGSGNAAATLQKFKLQHPKLARLLGLD